MRPSDKATADSRSVQSLAIVKKEKQLVIKNSLLCPWGKTALTFSLNSSWDDPRIFILLWIYKNRGLLIFNSLKQKKVIFNFFVYRNRKKLADSRKRAKILADNRKSHQNIETLGQRPSTPVVVTAHFLTLILESVFSFQHALPIKAHSVVFTDVVL